MSERRSRRPPSPGMKTDQDYHVVDDEQRHGADVSVEVTEKYRRWLRGAVKHQARDEDRQEGMAASSRCGAMAAVARVSKHVYEQEYARQGNHSPTSSATHRIIHATPMTGSGYLI